MDKNAPKFILAANGPNCNRGCEAILRGTLRILREHFDESSFLALTTYNNNKQFREQIRREHDIAVIHKKMHRPFKRFDALWFLFKLLRVTCPRLIKHIVYKDIKPYLHGADAVLALGGDNYSLEGGLPTTYTDLDDLVVAAKKPLVIWCASVGPFSDNPEYEEYIIEHFKKVYVLARETASVKYLNSHGLIDNVYRVGDPAFLMEPVQPMVNGIPMEIEPGSIGLNLSPLMKRFVTNGDIDKWINVASDIITELLSNTNRKIYLIPHVQGPPEKDDYTFMKNALEIVLKAADNRVELIPIEYNAPELKWVISRMEVFAGARTHSTIAALSSCVPTLSFAYSIKAKGLNEDIYGHSDYCITPDKLTAKLVVEKIQLLLKESRNIREHLEHKVPEIQKLALNSGMILKTIIEKHETLVGQNKF